MIDRRRITTAAATLGIAFGTGYLMQNGASLAERFSGAPEQEQPNISVPTEPDADEVKAELPTLPSDVVVPDIRLKGSVIHSRRLAALDTGFQAPTLSDAQTPNPFEMACMPAMIASPSPGAMIDITLSAPCQGNARFTVDHAGLSFADVTDSDGNYTVSIPAMKEEAEITVVFDSGNKVEAEALVLTLDGYTRSALVWEGQPGLFIHALEFGANYGEPGDVWAESARAPSHGVRALGGFMTRLGNPDVVHPKLVEVYSFPADRMAKSGMVRMIVEAEVTDATCGQIIAGNTIERRVDGHTSQAALELAMPDCDATGGYLVLKSLLQDMKIARN